MDPLLPEEAAVFQEEFRDGLARTLRTDVAKRVVLRTDGGHPTDITTIIDAELWAPRRMSPLELMCGLPLVSDASNFAEVPAGAHVVYQVTFGPRPDWADHEGRWCRSLDEKLTAC